MRKFSFIGVVLAFMLSACCSEVGIDVNEGKAERVVNFEVGNESWDEVGTTRAGEELLTPVTLLLVQDSKVIRQKVVEDNDYSMSIPYGAFDMYAVCGLSADLISEDISTSIYTSLRDIYYGNVDFAVSKVSVSNDNSSTTTSPISITAKRQMSWITATINNLPSGLSKVSIALKGQGDIYSIGGGWDVSDSAKNYYRKMIMQLDNTKHTATKSILTYPSVGNTGGTDFKIEIVTIDNKTRTYTYTSTNPLIPGRHLTLNLSISELTLVSDVSNEGWDEKTENGTLANPVES